MSIHLVIDTETTGLEPGSRAVELAAVAINDDGEVIDSFESLINPGMPIPPDVTAIHGITTLDVVGAPSTADALELFRLFTMKHAPLAAIAHNAPYDVGILAYDLDRSGMIQPTMQVVDTCKMALAIHATPNNKLATLVDHYKIIRTGEAHAAMSDVDACRQYWNIARKLTLPIYAPWKPSHLCSKEHVNIIQCIQTGAVFHFAYVDAKGVRTERDIIPYGIATTEKGVIFHGLDIVKNERRTFYADRMQV